MSHSDVRALKALEKIANMSGGPPFQPREVLMRKIAREAVASITEPAPIPPDPETAADNAALIAAIPEMVAALQGARALLIGLGFCGVGKHGSGDPEINAIDAVLQKVKP